MSAIVGIYICVFNKNGTCPRETEGFTSAP